MMLRIAGKQQTMEPTFISNQLEFSTLQKQKLQTSFSDIFHDLFIYFQHFCGMVSQTKSTSGSRGVFFNRQLARRAGSPPRLTHVAPAVPIWTSQKLQHFLGWKYGFQDAPWMVNVPIAYILGEKQPHTRGDVGKYSLRYMEQPVFLNP